MIKTEKDVQQDIKEKLRWEPMLRESDITVRVEDNVIVLEGTVNTLIKKTRAEEVAKEVAGLSSIENKIEIVRAGIDAHENKLLEREIKEAIRRETDVNKNWIKVSVHEGWATLEGTVQHIEQSDKIRQVAAGVEGVMGVANLIKVAKHEEEPVEESHVLEELEKENKLEFEFEKENKRKTRDRFQDRNKAEKEKVSRRWDKLKEKAKRRAERKNEFRSEKRNRFQRLVYNVARKITQVASMIGRVRSCLKNQRQEKHETNQS
jgi:osmotically-inducible protein OsmY